MAPPLFDRVAIIGIGLIGSSLARVIRRDSPATRITACARRAETLAAVRRLAIADETTDDPVAAVADADLVVLATPLSAYAGIAARIAPMLKPGTIVTDVGSVKETAIRDLKPVIEAGVQLVPGHPMTSHLPHLIAYTIVGTATALGDDLKSEVIAFSAGGFRDFTRIAASDPVMWRDIFLKNREAVLDVLQRFSEDLSGLQRAIRRGEGDALEDWFTRTRAIRRSVIEAKQA